MIERHIGAPNIIGALASSCDVRRNGARTAQDAKTPDYEAIVASPDRGRCRPADRPAPPARQDAGLHRGQDRDEGAGYGGQRRLLAPNCWRARSDPRGIVYAQDSAAVIERFVKDKFDIRAQKPAMKNVVHVIRDFDDPIPPECRASI